MYDQINKLNRTLDNKNKLNNIKNITRSLTHFMKLNSYKSVPLRSNKKRNHQVRFIASGAHHFFYVKNPIEVICSIGQNS